MSDIKQSETVQTVSPARKPNSAPKSPPRVRPVATEPDASNIDVALLSLRMALRDLRRDASCTVSVVERDGRLVVEIDGMRLVQTDAGKRIERKAATSAAKQG